MTSQPDGQTQQPDTNSQQEMPLIAHLLELRNRLLKMVLAVVSLKTWLLMDLLRL
jgi:sec-independent protein translocase protein TatC